MNHSSRRWIPLAVLLLAALPLRADPKILSATRPTYPIPKDETPKQALLRGCKVFDTLDAAYAMELFAVNDPKEKEFVTRYCRYAVALTEVEHAVEAKFGRHAADDLIHAAGETAESDLAKVEIKQDGDHATAKVPNMSDWDVALVRVDGVWKLDTRVLIAAIKPDDLQPEMDFYTAVSTDLSAIAEDVKAGKFPSAEKVIEVVKPLINPPPPPDGVVK